MSIWSSNNKTRLCAGCPNEDQKGECLLVGLHNVAARVTFVLERPQPESARFNTPLQDRDGKVFKHLLQQTLAALNLTNMPYNLTYLVASTEKGKPKTSTIAHCKEYVIQKLNFHREHYARKFPTCTKPHVIIALGATPTRALANNVKAFKSERGESHKADIGGYPYLVVPALSLGQLAREPGTAHLLAQDMANGIRVAMGVESTDPAVKKETRAAITEGYLVPTTDAELLEITDYIINYTGSAQHPDPDKWPISLDCETNSLIEHRAESKVLMISVSWDDRTGVAICLDHPEMPYSKEVARECVRRILACPKPKILHNAKFDWKFLVCREGFQISNLWWDTILAEHTLDEAKVGYYDLEALARIYAAEYVGYKAMVLEGLADSLRQQNLESLSHPEPDTNISFQLAAFYPDVLYTPVCESEPFLRLEHKDCLEIFALEKAYIEAHARKDADKKSNSRSAIRARCKRFGLAMPGVIKTRDYAKELEGAGYDKVPFKVLTTYGALDTDVTRLVCKEQRQRAHSMHTLPATTSLLRDLLMPATVVLGRAEYDGVCLDTEKLTRYIAEMQEAAAADLAALRVLACWPEFRPSSPEDVAHAVQHIFEFPPESFAYTKEGHLSVTSDWLAGMQKQFKGTARGDFAALLKDCRNVEKGLSSFLLPWQEMSSYDGRLHCAFNLNGTVTGRLSSKEPNMQNVPLYVYYRGEPKWNVKSLVVPDARPGHWGPEEDWLFYQLDIKAAEVRVLCAYADDPDLIDAMRKGFDIHSFIASKIFDIPYEHFEANKDSDPDIKLKRTATKRVVFGTIYGAGPAKIAEQIFGTLPVDEVLRMEKIQYAKTVMQLLFTKFAKINAYIQETQKEVTTQKYVESFLGRRRRFRIAHLDNWEKNKAQRAAVNFKIQSTASDIVLSQLIEVSENMHKLGGVVRLTVHDSIVGFVPKSSASKMTAFFDEHVVDAVERKFPWLPVPFAYDLEVGPNYGTLMGIQQYLETA